MRNVKSAAERKRLSNIAWITRLENMIKACPKNKVGKEKATILRAKLKAKRAGKKYVAKAA